MFALIGSPGAKAPPSFARRHAIAKRRRGPASEPILPGEAPLRGGGLETGASGPAQSLGRLPCWSSSPSTMLEILLSLPCQRTFCLIVWETYFCPVRGPVTSAVKSFFTKAPLPIISRTSPPITLLRVFALAVPSAWNPSPHTCLTSKGSAQMSLFQ